MGKSGRAGASGEKGGDCDSLVQLCDPGAFGSIFRQQNELFSDEPTWHNSDASQSGSHNPTRANTIGKECKIRTALHQTSLQLSALLKALPNKYTHTPTPLGRRCQFV